MNADLTIRHVVITLFLTITCLVPATANAMRFSHIVHDREEVRQCDRCHLPAALSIIPEQSV